MGGYLSGVKGKFLVPILLMAAFAITRTPGMLPQNFSAAYAIAFCAGVFFPSRLAWWVPMVTLLVTDLLLNCYYQFALGYPCFKWANMMYLGFNYLSYAVLILLGKKFTARASFLGLLGGGMLGAVLFYLITNTASWLVNPFHNPEYVKTFQGWLWALTKGVGGWPETWTFFRNTMLSGGIFTGLFVAAMKFFEVPAEAEEKEEAEAPEPAPEPKPEEAKA